MKSTIHEVTRTARRRLVFCDASCDFVDPTGRLLPSHKWLGYYQSLLRGERLL